jgi:hypothetical protein
MASTSTRSVVAGEMSSDDDAAATAAKLGGPPAPVRLSTHECLELASLRRVGSKGSMLQVDEAVVTTGRTSGRDP